MKKLKELNTVREVKDLISLITRLFGNMIEAMLNTLSVIILIGRLLTKPVEIAIALLRDIRTLTTPKRHEETKKEAESKKDSSSSFSFALFSPCITEVMIT